MHITEDALKFFLYETHLLQKSITFAEIIREKNDEKKKALNLENSLNELFLFRMERDPGFQQFVLESVAQNQEIISKTQKYITKLFCDFTCSNATFYTGVEEIDIIENQELEEIIANQVEYYKKDFTTFITAIDNSNSIKFYQYLYKQAVSIQDDVAVTAIRTIIHFIEAYHAFGKMPFIETTDHIRKSFNRKRDQESQYYIYRHLRYSDYYVNPERKEYEMSLLRCVSFQKDTRDIIATNFEVAAPAFPWMEKSEFLLLDSNKKHEFIQYIRFTNAALFIAAEFWFGAKEEQEKLAILNKEYTFEIDENNLSSLSIEEIDASANVLCDGGYFSDAFILFNHCFNRVKSDIDRFFFLDDMAYCCKNMENYQEAKGWYEAAYEIISQYIDNNNSIFQPSLHVRKTKFSTQYLTLLVKKYIAEMDYHLGHEIEANKRMKEVLKDLKLLNNNEKTKLLLEISIGYHNTFNPNEEYEILNEILGREDINSLLWDHINKRMTFLEKCVNSAGEYNIEILKKMEKLEQIPNLVSGIEPALNSFQFTRALELHEKVYALNSEASPWEKCPIYFLAMAYLQVQQFEKARIYFEVYRDECPQTYKSITHSAGYPGICLILECKEEEGIKSLCNEISSFSSILQDEEVGQVIGTLLNNVANELFFTKKEGLVKILDDLTPEIEKYLPIEESTYYVVSAYVSIRWFEKAIEAVDRLINEKDFDENNRALFIFRKGNLYSDACDFDTAISCYQEADKSYYYSLPTLERAMLMHRMADAYIEKMNLIEARKCLETACKIAPENTEVKKLKSDIGSFLEDHLSLESVKCHPARLSLKTAEREALDLYRSISEKEEFDFSPPLGYYAKGLEILLNEKIWTDVRSSVFEEFSTDDYYGIPDFYYTNLPNYLKDGQLTNRSEYQKSVSLGTWERIDIDRINGHPVIDSVNKYIKEKVGKKYIVVKAACAFLAPYRNKVFHKEVKGKKEVIELRREAVRYLNAVIELIYGSENMEEFNKTFKEKHGDIALFEEAMEYVTKGKDDEAFDLLSEALKIDPKNNDALVGKAQILIRKKEFDKAEQCIDSALSIDENDYDAIHEKGVLYFGQGRYDVAAKFFQDAICIKPDHEFAWLNLGCVFMEMYDHSMALQCFKKVFELNPDNEHAKKEFDNCNNAVQHAKETLEQIEKKIQSDKKNGALHSGKGLMLFMLGNYSKALESFNTSIELGKNDAGVYLFKGRSLMRLNRYDEADEAIEKYSKLSESAG